MSGKRDELARLRYLRVQVDARIAQLEAELSQRVEEPPVACQPVTDKVIREWARTHGVPVNARGRVRPDVRDSYNAAHAGWGSTVAVVPVADADMSQRVDELRPAFANVG